MVQIGRLVSCHGIIYWFKLSGYVFCSGPPVLRATEHDKDGSGGYEVMVGEGEDPFQFADFDYHLRYRSCLAAGVGYLLLKAGSVVDDDS